MAFDGRDYHRQWKEAISELQYTRDAEEIDGALRHIEWILWEAIRGVFFYFSVFIAGVSVSVPVWLIGMNDTNWIVKTIIVALAIIIALLSYWFLRFLFWYEISRHVKDRKFGNHS